MSDEKRKPIKEMDVDELIEFRTRLYDACKDFTLPAHKTENAIKLMKRINTRLAKIS